MSNLDKLRAELQIGTPRYICRKTCEAILKDVEEMDVPNTSEQNMGWHNCLVEIKQILKGKENACPCGYEEGCDFCQEDAQA